MTLQTGAPQPFQGPLWEQAKRLLTNDQTETAMAGLLKDHVITSELTNLEFGVLAQAAADDGTITDDERALLEILGNQANANLISEGLSETADFNPSSLSFSQIEDRPVSAATLIDRGLAGSALNAVSNDLGAWQRRELAAADAKASIGPDQPLNLETKDGQWAIIDRLGQLHQKSEAGRDSCVATSMVALAVNRGSVGLRNLAKAVLRGDQGNQQAALLIRGLNASPMSLRMADLNAFAESLYRSLKAKEPPAQASQPGLHDGVIDRFMTANQDLLYSLFEFGGHMMSVDTDGDTQSNHMVAMIPGRGGDMMVFEPWEVDKVAPLAIAAAPTPPAAVPSAPLTGKLLNTLVYGAGASSGGDASPVLPKATSQPTTDGYAASHHLETDSAQVRTYLQAARRSYTLTDPLAGS